MTLLEMESRNIVKEHSRPVSVILVEQLAGYPGDQLFCRPDLGVRAHNDLKIAWIDVCEHGSQLSDGGVLLSHTGSIARLCGLKSSTVQAQATPRL